MSPSINYPPLLKEYFKNTAKLAGVSFSEPIFFIAEAGTGHGGDLTIAKKMVDKCVAYQVGAIKFQHVIAKEILHPLCGKVILSAGDIDLFEYFLAIQEKADIRFWKLVKEYCDQKGILFLCSFFGSESFNDLKNIAVTAYKIASPEMNYYRLWDHLKDQSEPVFFSSGVAKAQDIEHLFNYLKEVNYDLSRLVHLHCVTAYPAPIEFYNLQYANAFEECYGVLTGLSDHSTHGFLVPLVFTALKASRGLPVVIEKHFTLSSLKNNIDDPVAISEQDLSQLLPLMHEFYRKFTATNFEEKLSSSKFINKVVKTLYEVWENRGLSNVFSDGKTFDQKNLTALLVALLGNGVKTLSPSEEIDYHTTKRSLLATRAIQAGEKITHKNAAYLRSEKNLVPGMDYHNEKKISNVTAKVSVRNGEAITESKINW